jgi:hypothetical protein
MSEDEACRRIDAAPLAHRFPDLLARIERGELTLSTLCLLRRALTAESYDEIVAAAAGRTKTAVQALLAKRAPKPDVPTAMTTIPTQSTIPTVGVAPAAPAPEAPRGPHASRHGPCSRGRGVPLPSIHVRWLPVHCNAARVACNAAGVARQAGASRKWRASMKTLWVATLSCTLSLSSACARPSDGHPDVPTVFVGATARPSVGPESVPPAPADARAPGRGRLAAGNDPQILALLEPALACTITPDSGAAGWVVHGCAAYTAWSDARRMFESDAGRATLLNLIEDDSWKVRMLAAEKYGMTARPEHIDRADALRLVAAAQHEEQSLVAYWLGIAVGNMDVAKTGQLDAVKSVLTSHPLVRLRVGLVDNLLWNNSTSRDVYDLTVAMTKDPALRHTALGAFFMGGREFMADTCALWQSCADDPAEGSHCSHMIGQSCPSPYYDSLIATVQAKVERGTIDGTSAGALAAMCDREATPAQRARSALLARRLAGDAPGRPRGVRFAGMLGAMECDPAAGRAFVRGFADDRDDWVAARARELLAR